jgi:hypothetical protein
MYRALIALRPSFGPGIQLLDAADGVVAYERGPDHVVALNFGAEPAPAPEHGEVLVGDGGATLAPHSGFVARRA